MARKQAGVENLQKLGRRQAELLKGLCLVQKQWIHSSTSRAWRSENKQVKHTEKGGRRNMRPNSKSENVVGVGGVALTFNPNYRFVHRSLFNSQIHSDKFLCVSQLLLFQCASSQTRTKNLWACIRHKTKDSVLKT